MPKMDGLTMLKHIKKHSKYVKTAIFTNFENKNTLHKAIEIGVDHFFPKPIDRDHLLKTLRMMCDEIHMRVEMEKRLTKQQRMLHTVNEIAHQFLQQPDWNAALRNEMARLQVSANIDFVAIYRNDEHDSLHASLHFVLGCIRTHHRIHYRRHGLMHWHRALRKEEYVSCTINETDRSKRKFMERFGLKEMLLFPIKVDHRFWGFLTVGYRRKTHTDTTEIKLFTTVASIIGSAINNQRNLQSLKLSSFIFEHAMDGILITDEKNRILHVNDAFCTITGYSRQDVLGKDPKILKSGRHDTPFYRDMWRQIDELGYWQGEIVNRKKNGEIYIEWLTINAIRDKSGNTTQYLGIFSDVTHHRKDYHEYAYLATHDPLTGLPNRLLLDDRLEHAIHNAKRNGKCVAVIFCDLDNFKPVNDTYGHDVGDEVLKECAARLKSVLRKEDTVCRYGGDEFVILIDTLRSFEFLEELLVRIKKALDRPFFIQDTEFILGGSIGSAIYPVDARDGTTLLKYADAAMYKAKHGGKNRIAYYQSDPSVYCTIPYSI
jgi:diguanylate cyclase (GGDEF)-like protein/PAS domain S-box-containing protein